MTLDSDVLILGGGCAGLSLAAALGNAAPQLRVHILEQRRQYRRDRTWCYWNTAHHPFESAVTRRWHSWRVRLVGREAHQHSDCYSYDHIPADRFYTLGQQLIAKAGYQLSLGVQVQAVGEQERHCVVSTDRGELRSRYVFDARPAAPSALQPILLQRFEGWHVRTENACFDPATVDLMDFQPSGVCQRASFLYVLPFTPTEALVEATYLDHPTLPAADASSDLTRYLNEQGSGGYEILYREHGALPMGDRATPKRQHGTLFDIGARGGRIKPSSGYAFLRIQRQSAVLARALAHGEALPWAAEPKFFSLLDRIFLHALERQPQRTPEYFFSLFRRLPPDVLVRFLSEVASPTEVCHVMMSLPKADFLRAALFAGRGDLA